MSTSIREFLREEVLLPRLAKHQVLAVYDPERRYQKICLELAADRRVVVDASESSIESRFAAITALGQLGEKAIDELLVYVPAQKPLDEESKQKDPFAIYAACGAVFPEGDGDSFQSIALKAKPDFASQVRNIFIQNSNPDFEVIDAIGGGLGWPNLRAMLRVESSQDILFALLHPNEVQQESLKGSDAWVVEAHSLLQNSLGLKLKTKGKTWSSIADELWRYLLFSEFVLDLPDSLPDALVNVPCAPEYALPIVNELCERLRGSLRTQAEYIERAEKTEQELNLPLHCTNLSDLGLRDTFPFEERTFLRRALRALQEDELDLVRSILKQHVGSVWSGKGENQAQWDQITAVTNLLETCADLERSLPEHSKSLEALIGFYVSRLRNMDSLQREFEQSVSQYEWRDVEGLMDPLKSLGRKAYGRLAEKVQLIFTKYLQQSGWPLNGYLSNNEVFDTLVAPRLTQSGHKIAYIMVDALRYEVGVALERQLAEEGQVELRPAMAQLPSVTPVGMASLLPGAQGGLRLVKNENSFLPYINDQLVSTVPQRMELIRQLYGQRFEEARLEKFVRDKPKLDPNIDLLVLRSVEIDSNFENNPESAPGELVNALQRIRVAVNLLKKAGFREVIIATDHGFFMNSHAGAGDTCPKPLGDWINIHNRCLLGEGGEDANHYNLPTEKLGTQGDFSRLAGPLSLAAYRTGLLYYHGGASLQELVVPVILLKFHETDQPEVQQAKITLNYKQGAKRITTRMPVFDISVESQDLFSQDTYFEILLEAQDKRGEVVGEAKPGGSVNPATLTLSLKPGESKKITLKMSLEFQGKFKVKALNPTTLSIYDQLDLQTDYTV